MVNGYATVEMDNVLGDGEGVEEGVVDGVGEVDGVILRVTVGDGEGDELAPILRDAVGVTVGDGDEEGVGEGDGEGVGEGEALETATVSDIDKVTNGWDPNLD